MNHARVRSLLGDYMEGDLAAPEHAAVDAHLDGCLTCSQELRDLRTVVGLVRGLPDPQPPADLSDAVMARIAAGEGARRLRLIPAGLRRVAQPGVGAALAAGLAGLLAWTLLPSFLPGSGEGPTAPPRIDRASIAVPVIPESEFTAGAASDSKRRPIVRKQSPAVPYLAGVEMPRRGSAFRGGVAPNTPVLEADEIDRQLERLMIDPIVVLRRMGGSARGEHFARLAQVAARRGRATELASSLIASRDPIANQLAPRFLAAAFAEDVQRGRLGSLPGLR